MKDLDRIMFDYEALEEYEKLIFLEWLYRADPHKWDFATMTKGLRNFYDPTAKRPK